MIRAFQDHRPDLDPTAWVAENAIVIGRCTLGADSSVWYGAVLRGDINFISLGKRTNIQDNSVLHVTEPSSGNPKGHPLIIGEDVTVGHKAILHGCRIGNSCLIGMNATVLDGVEIGEESIVAAGALVTMNKKFPPRSLILGSPARVVRTLSDDEVKSLYESADHYVQFKNQFLESGL